MDKKRARKSVQEYDNSFTFKITEAALHLRTVIQQLKITCQELPNPLTPDAIVEGEVVPPDLLLLFFRVLYVYTGNKKAGASARVERYVQSACSDTIFVTTRGILKPTKHLCLAQG